MYLRYTIFCVLYYIAHKIFTFINSNNDIERIKRKKRISNILKKQKNSEY